MGRWLGLGGYAPSIMGTILKSGPYFVTAAVAQASRLINNTKARMASRRSTKKSRRPSTGHTRRSHRKK